MGLRTPGFRGFWRFAPLLILITLLSVLPGQAAPASSSTVRMIVGLNVPFVPEGNLSVQAAANQQAAILQAQQNLLNSLVGYNVQTAAQFRYIPYMTLEVDDAVIAVLRASPLVSSLRPESVIAPLLAESTPRIGAPAAWSAGYDGTGQTIAVLDSGIQDDHPFFGTRVVKEACFSVNDPDSGVFSLCPNGEEADYSDDAAAACPYAFCEHGTHVAGIAAGNGASFDGVARNANILGVQVFYRSENANECASIGYSAPCIVSRETPILEGLQWVYSQRGNYNIAAVNLSLGGGLFNSYCDNIVPYYRDAINLLRSVGIATIAGSGNSRDLGIMAPACVSGAISVGATYDNSDEVWEDNQPIPGLFPGSGSNTAPILKLLAPGANITSSVPGGGFQQLTGTSMATPHVSGAWALLRDAVPGVTIDQALAALQSTGVLVTDTYGDLTTPRIQVDAAINALLGSTVPTVGPVIINEVKLQATQAVELHNPSAAAVNITGWQMLIYSSGGTVEHTYTLPTFTLNAGAYVILWRGTGTNNAANLYMGNYSTNWAAGSSGAALLRSGTLGIDFVRWGSSAVDPAVGENFAGDNPTSPTAGKTLGRDPSRIDYDEGTDWTTQNPTLGAVNQPDRPVNDAFANAITFTNIPYSQNLVTHTATTEGSEPTPSCTDYFGRSVWYKYIPSTSGQVQFSTVGTDYDTAMAVYTGVALGSLTQIGCNEDIVPGIVPQSKVVVNVTAGVPYYVQVGGYGGQGGLLKFSAKPPIANDDFNTPVVVTSPLPFVYQQDTIDAGFAGDDPQPSCYADTIAHSVWFRYTTTGTDRVRFETVGSGYDTVLSLWTGTQGNLTEAACHDDVDLFGSNFASRIDGDVDVNQTYYIMVSSGAGDSDPEKSLVLAVTALNTPNLINPADGAAVPSPQPTFNWSTVASAVSYQIQIGTTNPPTTPPITVNATSYSPPTPLAQITGYYYWRVRTVWANGKNSSYSPARAFILPSAAGAAPIRNYFQTSTPTLTWSRVTTAAQYQVQADREATFAAPILFDEFVPATSLSVTVDPPLTDGVYYYRVCALAAGQTTCRSWSAVDNFVVDAP
ncbi:MAG: S8 family serine peptidase [Anaerolineae bacterium]|nr:S8 family serine peptidase [Anaerolineae bacterium]